MSDSDTAQIILDNPPVADRDLGLGQRGPDHAAPHRHRPQRHRRRCGDTIEHFTIATLAAHGQLFAAPTGGVALTAGADIPATGPGPSFTAIGLFPARSPTGTAAPAPTASPTRPSTASSTAPPATATITRERGQRPASTDAPAIGHRRRGHADGDHRPVDSGRRRDAGARRHLRGDARVDPRHADADDARRPDLHDRRRHRRRHHDFPRHAGRHQHGAGDRVLCARRRLQRRRADHHRRHRRVRRHRGDRQRRGEQRQRRRQRHRDGGQRSGHLERAGDGDGRRGHGDRRSPACRLPTSMRRWRPAASIR